jgi:hypothetical protein
MEPTAPDTTYPFHGGRLTGWARGGPGPAGLARAGAARRHDEVLVVRAEQGRPG